jgi:DNA (cytosine-5)-methyltransferase 1
MALFKSVTEPIRELALFAGSGGGILGARALDHRIVCAVEFDPYAAACLVARQNDGSLPAFPVWDDVRSFDGLPWRGRVDLISGGFPCQDISAAGSGAGIDGERSGLWREMARIICEVRPGRVFVENSPALVGRGLGRVLGDLAEMGYHAEWGVVGPDDAAWHNGDPVADHERDRIWIFAFRVSPDFPDTGGKFTGRAEIPDANGKRRGQRGAGGTGGRGRVEGREPAAGITSTPQDSGFRPAAPDADSSMCNRGPDDPGRGAQQRVTSRRGGKSPGPPPPDPDVMLL